MQDDILNRIRARLIEAAVSFREVEHESTRTSEESARVRGEPLGVGAKALLLRVDDTFNLFVVPADKRVDSAALRRHFRAKSLRFATPDELAALTGLEPGSLPPFGWQAAAEREGIPVYSVFTNEQLAEMIRTRVRSKEELKRIEGIGDARVAKHASALLAILPVGDPVRGGESGPGLIAGRWRSMVLQTHEEDRPHIRADRRCREPAVGFLQSFKGEIGPA